MDIDVIIQTIRDPRSPAKSEEIEVRLKSLEELLGHRIPDDYKDFLSRYGRPFYNDDTLLCPESEDDIDGHDISYWFGVDGDNYDDVLRKSKFYGDRFPPGCFAIGSTIFGDVFLIDLTEDPSPVYIWMHEEEITAAGEWTPYYSNMTRLANSFSDFLEKLYPEEYDDDPV